MFQMELALKALTKILNGEKKVVVTTPPYANRVEIRVESAE